MIFALIVGTVYFDLGRKEVNENHLQNLISDRFVCQPLSSNFSLTIFNPHAGLEPSSSWLWTRSSLTCQQLISLFAERPSLCKGTLLLYANRVISMSLMQSRECWWFVPSVCVLLLTNICWFDCQKNPSCYQLQRYNILHDWYTWYAHMCHIIHVL